eukprot:4448745-Pleurochrysis_carterae.AAC.1
MAVTCGAEVPEPRLEHSPKSDEPRCSMTDDRLRADQARDGRYPSQVDPTSVLLGRSFMASTSAERATRCTLLAVVCARDRLTSLPCALFRLMCKGGSDHCSRRRVSCICKAEFHLAAWTQFVRPRLNFCRLLVRAV